MTYGNWVKTTGAYSNCIFQVNFQASFLKIVNIEIDFYDGLLADYCKEKGAGAIVKGLRAMSDFEYEFQMALTNKKLNPDTETVFLTTSAEYMYLSSSMVKQIGAMKGDISSFVPAVIHKKIINRLLGKDA